MNSRFSRSVGFLLIALPIASLVLNAISWLRYGIDLPFFDDWTNYINGTIGSLESSHLFKFGNDTFSPIGYALDALAQRHLNGNTIAYQLLSMLVVLGGLLYFQWRLLRWALMDRLVAAACFVFTLLMLQPGTYWGRENLAYHQALPLLFGMGALNLLFVWEGRDRWRLPGVFLLGLLAGVSYISGAVAIFSMGLAMVSMGCSSSVFVSRIRLLRGGVAFLAAGLVTLIFQLRPILAQPGFVHRADAPLSLPNKADFWFYFLGKTGRSLALPIDKPVLSLSVVCLVVIITAALSIYYLWRHFCVAAANERELRIGVVFAVLGAGVLSYMLMIAAGRTNLRPPEVSAALDVFVFGFYRFHYFWATLFWPWLVAGIFGWFSARGFVQSRAKVLWVFYAALLVIAITLMVRGNVLKHGRAYREEMAVRQDAISCLLSQVQKGDGIYCQAFNWRDVSAGYEHARAIGASFVRNFPILPVAIGSNDPPPLFRLTRDNALVEMKGLVTEGRNAAKYGGYVANADPQFVLRTDQPDKMARCSLLDVSVLLRASSADRAQLFYRPRGQGAFDERHAVVSSVDVPAEGYRRLDFQIGSPVGFEDGLRFDPVMSPQPIQVGEIEVRCRIAGAPPIVGPQ